MVKQPKKNTMAIIVFSSLALLVIILGIGAIYLIPEPVPVEVGEPEPQVKEEEVVVTEPAFPSSYLDKEYRIKFSGMNKDICLYPNNTWACHNDPNMVFKITPSDGNKVRVTHVLDNKCLFIEKDTMMLKNWDCWNDPGMDFIMIDAGDGKIKLKHNFSGKCLKPDTTENGSSVRGVDCGDSYSEITLIPV